MLALYSSWIWGLPTAKKELYLSHSLYKFYSWSAIALIDRYRLTHCSRTL
jgi:hypothetical protein